MENNSIYLRDAGVLLPGNERDFSKRLSRCVDLAISNKLDIQITLADDYFNDPNPRRRLSLLKELEKFEDVLIHLHLDYSHTFGDNRFTDEAFDEVEDLLRAAGNVKGFCVHPDLVADFSVLERLRVHDAYIGIEVLDPTVLFGNRFSQISGILKKFEFLDIVLDTSHILEMEKWGEPSYDFYLNHFRDKIREIHLSRPGNHYSPGRLTDKFSTNHSLFSTNSEGVNMLSGLPLPENVNHVIEGVIPYGKYGEELLAKESRLLKARF